MHYAGKAVVAAIWLLAGQSADAADDTAVKSLSSTTSAISQPAAVALPDLAFTPTPRDIRNFDEYFLFHKAGVGTATALTDIRECNSYSQALQPMAKLIQFVPLGGQSPSQSDNGAALDNAFRMYGLVGVWIFQWAIDSVASSNERGNTRRCMHYKGYHRFGTSETIWSAIHKGSQEAVSERLAIIASGQQPPGEELDQ